jgi:pyridoxal phosphate enzyme (YggS family)
VADLDRLRSNLEGVRGRIAAACARAGRDPASVTLIVVTKTIPKELIPRLADLGVRDIGENRPVEGLDRVGGLSVFRRHMIGHLQTNKLGKALQWADVIHSVDRASLLRELARSNKRLPVFVQINVSGEASKGGYRPEDAEAAVAEARRSLDVQGLMTMAPEGADARPHFRRLRELAAGAGLPGLSMGMSQDYEVAVEEGATHVRVGTAIFEGVRI